MYTCQHVNPLTHEICGFQTPPDPIGVALMQEHLREHRPTERQMLVLKSAAHYRAAFDPIAVETIEVDAPGITSPRLERYPYKNIRRPIYPLDKVS